MTGEAGSTAAVVVHWNRRDLLRANLPSWIRQSVPFRRLLVVDNGSGDGSAEELARRSEVELVRLDRNRGFAAAANLGMERALADPATECVALVNNDVRLAPDWHQEALAALEAPGIGAVATCLLRADMPEVIDGAGITWSESGWADNHLSGRPLPAAGGAPTPVSGFSAGAALLRREMLEECGLFAGSFFAYQEDVDLSLRAAASGWRFLLAPAAVGWHSGQASNLPFPIGGTWADFYNARNRLAVLARSVPGRQWRRHWREILRTHLRATARSFREGRAGAVLAGTLHAGLRLPAALGARRRLARGHPE